MSQRRFDSEILADMTGLEKLKTRPLTDLILSGGTDADARRRLEALELRMQVLRAELATPPEGTAPKPPP